MAFSFTGAVAGTGGLMVAFSSCRKDTISCLTIVCTSKKEKEVGAGAGVLGAAGVVAPQGPLPVPTKDFKWPKNEYSEQIIVQRPKLSTGA